MLIEEVGTNRSNMKQRSCNVDGKMIRLLDVKDADEESGWAGSKTAKEQHQGFQRGPPP